MEEGLVLLLEEGLVLFLEEEGLVLLLEGEGLVLLLEEEGLVLLLEGEGLALSLVMERFSGIVDLRPPLEGLERSKRIGPPKESVLLNQ